MALFDRLNRMARTLGEITGEALEAGREAREADRNESRMDAERAAAQEQFCIIGEYYYRVYSSGGEVAEEVVEACEAAKAHMDAIAAEEERLRREAERQAECAGAFCPECGTQNREGTKFCCECGTKLMNEQPQERFCPECGASVEAGNRFCGACGCRMEE